MNIFLRKAQVAPFMVVVIAVVILAIAATMLIGELSFQRVRVGNITDSAMISATSAFCRSLNQIRIIHTRMFLNYLQLQTALLAKGIWPNKYVGYAAAIGWSLIGVEMNRQLYAQAKEVTKDMAKNLRIAIYEASFGGALVDEPKPFLESEVDRDPETNKVIGLDYDAYLLRDSNFTIAYRQFKKDNKDNWYLNNNLAYYFNKSDERMVLNCPGQLQMGGGAVPSCRSMDYEAHVSATLRDVPTSVSLSAQKLVVFFLYWREAWPAPVISVGFVPHPYAWIRRVDFGNNIFSLNMQKTVPFRRLPFFPRQSVELQHTARVKVTRGSSGIWAGFSFGLTR